MSIELIDRNKIDFYGCDYETDDCENKDCSKCRRAECSPSQIRELPTITLPDNPTNGDVIKALFNVKVKRIYKELKLITVIIAEETKVFILDWWNAPYKGVE